MDETGTDDADCCRKIVGAIRSLVNAGSLQLNCARRLHEAFPVLVLLYDSETNDMEEEGTVCN